MAGFQMSTEGMHVTVGTIVGLVALGLSFGEILAAILISRTRIFGDRWHMLGDGWKKSKCRCRPHQDSDRPEPEPSFSQGLGISVMENV
jgi:hypothetical protein